MIYSISYDLKKPGQNYSDLIDKIKAIGAWAHPCDSHWLVDTSSNANAIYEYLSPHIDKNDSLLITRFNEYDCAGWISKEIWQWINERKDARNLYR